VEHDGIGRCAGWGIVPGAAEAATLCRCARGGAFGWAVCGFGLRSGRNGTNDAVEFHSSRDVHHHCDRDWGVR